MHNLILSVIGYTTVFSYYRIMTEILMILQLGIFVVYFLDYVIGGSWWIMLLYLIELIAVFVVRGRPYSGETVVATLFSRASICAQTWLAPMLSFTWNVILPTMLLVSFNFYINLVWLIYWSEFLMLIKLFLQVFLYNFYLCHLMWYFVIKINKVYVFQLQFSLCITQHGSVACQIVVDLFYQWIFMKTMVLNIKNAFIYSELSKAS